MGQRKRRLCNDRSSQDSRRLSDFQFANGKTGKCLSLVTRSTGFFGSIMGMPIAAGNLFIGSFDVGNAMSNPLKATKFGLPFRHVPTYLAGYYKYKAGDQFTEGGKPVSGKRDYAIFMPSCTKPVSQCRLLTERMLSPVPTWFQ